MLALGAIRDAELHVVAQIVEAELVVGAVGDVAGVALAALAVVEIVHDDADAHAQRLVNAAHPIRIALGQVIVHRDHVDALARERVQIHRQRRDQRLAFAGLHFGDLAAMQHHAADQLHIEMPHVQNAASGFAHRGEGRNQQIVERGALRDLFAELDGLRGQILVRQRLHLRLQIVDRRNDRPHLLDFALMLGAEYFRESLIEHGCTSSLSLCTVSKFAGRMGCPDPGRDQQRSSARWCRRARTFTANRLATRYSAPESGVSASASSVSTACAALFTIGAGETDSAAQTNRGTTV